jgi:excisionase family DNA binding protein
VAHKLPKAEALERIKRLLGEVKTQYAEKISCLRETWKGDVGTFAFTAMGFDVSGTPTVTDKDVTVEGRLPFLASMFSDQIEEVIRERATELLAKKEVVAPVSGAAAKTKDGAKAPEGVKVTTSGGDKSGEFFTFDEVLRQLSIDETKLKRLVSEGEIRAFREGDQMKFRKADVENLDLTGARSEEECGVIDLSVGKKGDSETLTDDSIFDEGDDLDLSSAEAGMATAEISSHDENVGMRTDFVEQEARAEHISPVGKAEKGGEGDEKGKGLRVVLELAFVVALSAWAIYGLRSCKGGAEQPSVQSTKAEDPNRILTWEEQMAKARAKVKAGETKK